FLRDERQRSHAERFRSDLARAELQAVRGAGRAFRAAQAPVRCAASSIRTAQASVRCAAPGKWSSLMRRLVVVGNGMAGVACVEHILKQKPDFEITIFGDETHVNYNRILLSLVLAGEKDADEIVLNDVEWYKSNNIRARLGAKIDHIDRPGRTVVD